MAATIISIRSEHERALEKGVARLAEGLDLAMRIKPERHHFKIERGAAPAQPRHMSLTGG